MNRREAAAQEKLNSILSEATRLFAEKGFHGTAVPEVAAAAGVGAGTIYRYFDNKEHLVNGVFRNCKESLRDYIERDAQDLSELNLEQQFCLLWRNLCCFAREKPEQFYFLELQEHSKYLDAQSKRLERQVLAPIRLFAIRGQHDGKIRKVPTMALIAMVWGAFVGLFKANAHGYTSLPPEVIDEAGALCWRMIAAS